MKQLFKNKNKKMLCTLIFVMLFLVGMVVAVVTSKSTNVSSNSLNSEQFSIDSDNDSNGNQQTSTDKSCLSVVSKSVKVKSTTKTSTKKSTTLAVTYSFPKNINKAVKGELVSVKGIGDVMAEKILDYKKSVGTIHNMNELLKVSGIGNAKLLLLEKYFYVADEDFSETSTITQKAAAAIATVVTTNSCSQKVTIESKKAVTIKALLQKVNINTADAAEISEKLLLTGEQAKDIVYTRSLITKYTSYYELFLCTKITQKEIQEREKYIEV